MAARVAAVARAKAAAVGKSKASAKVKAQAIKAAKKVRSERVNTRIRKTVDTAVRDFGELAQVVELTERLAAELPETAQAV